jgi:hypothetical protein
VAPAWLHQDLRVVIDRDLAGVDVAATATLAGQAISATVVVDPANARELAVALDPAARGTGALAIHVEGTVAATDGTAGDIITDVSATLAPWSQPVVVDGVAAGSPAITLTAQGDVIAAWSAGDPGSRRLVVAQLVGDTWQSLGDPPTTTDPSSPAIALDAQGAPVIAWVETTLARAARWNGHHWDMLAPPGAGTQLALAAPAGGAPVLALFGASASVSELTVDGNWRPLVDDVPLQFVGEPQLAVASTERLAIVWIDASSTLHVARLSRGAWTLLAPIELGHPPIGIDRASIAVRDDVTAIAYDRWASSFTVEAAEAAGDATTWTRIGPALDARPADDAFAPAIALDAQLRPIVAWTEVAGTDVRGLAARWDGRAWGDLAAASWLPETTTIPTRPVLALSTGDAPAIAATVAGTASVALNNGP